MKRLLMMVLALSLVAVMALPAYAEVQNIKVDGSIDIYGIYRDNWSATLGGGRFTFGDQNSTLAGTQEFGDGGSRDLWHTKTTLGVAADLTDNVSAKIKLANERDWGEATAASTQTIVVHESYITIQEMLYSALTVQAGRFPLQVADGLALGDGVVAGEPGLAPDLSIQNQWDAVAGILDYDPLTLIIGTAKVSDGAQSAADDVDLYVIDAIYKFEDDMNSVLDVYWATAHYSSPVGTTTGPDAWPGSILGTSTNSIDVHVLAGVLTMEPVDGLSGKLALAMQMGDYLKTATTSRDLDAMAFDLDLNYAIDNEYAPVVGIEYVYRSGADTSKTTGDYEGWLSLFESQTNGMIYDPNTNISAICLKASAMPADRLTVGLEYWIYTLDEALKTAVANTYTTDDEAGQELDLMARYAYTEDVTIGLDLAWFFPGGYYATNNDETATQALLSLGLKF